jgi:hypothetical protein
MSVLIFARLVDFILVVELRQSKRGGPPVKNDVVQAWRNNADG